MHSSWELLSGLLSVGVRLTWQSLFSYAKFGSESWRRRWLTCLFQVHFSCLCIGFLWAGWWMITVNHLCFAVSGSLPGSSSSFLWPSWKRDTQHDCAVIHCTFSTNFMYSTVNFIWVFFRVRFQFCYTVNEPENFHLPLYSIIVQNRNSGYKKWVPSIVRQRLAYSSNKSTN
jgi:hypothetical protein